MVYSCGHCRQILISFCDHDSNAFSISCHGKRDEAFNIKSSLPKAFSNKDLGVSQSSGSILDAELYDLYQKDFGDIQENDHAALCTIFSKLRPIIVSAECRTTATTIAMLKLSNGKLIPGILLQDAAYQTTDAIFSAYAHAVARFGSKIEISAVYLLDDGCKAGNVNDRLSLCLTRSEVGLIGSHQSKAAQHVNTPIYIYQQTKEAGIQFVAAKSLADIAIAQLREVMNGPVDIKFNQETSHDDKLVRRN